MKKILVMTLVSSLVLINGVAKGIQFHAGQQVSLAAGDTVYKDHYAWAQTIKINGVVQGDLIAGGQWIEIQGTISQDLFAFGQKVTVLGTVRGDVNGFTQEVRINGKVDGGIRAAAARVIINGNVKGDILAGSGQVIVSKDAIVEGDITIGAGELIIEGTVLGSVKGNVGRAVLAGVVGKDVDLAIDDGFEVPAGAKIGGDLKYRCRKPIDIKGTVAGQVTFKEYIHYVKVKRLWSPIKVVFKIWSVVAALVIGLLLVALSKRATRSIGDAVHSNPLKSLGWGFLFLIAVPVIFLISLILIITIPLGFALLGLYLVLLYLSRIFAGVFVGREILERLIGREVSPYGAVVIGVVLVWVLISLPYVGWLFHLTAIIFGLGGMLLGLRKMVTPQTTPTSAMQPQQ